MILKKVLISIALLAGPLMLFAQQTAENGVDMADTMRSTGLIVYLISLDRKISKIEKRINSRNQS